ncbi:MAG: reverse gyrase [bacterium]
MSITVLYQELPQSYLDFERIDSELKSFEKFFEYCFGYPLKSIQRNYCKRFFADLCFSMVCPTGTGKTILGLFLALYSCFIKNKRSLMIFPSQLLVKQTQENLLKYLPKVEQYIGRKIDESEYLFFLSYETKQIKDEKISRISEQDYKLLVITNQFLARRFEILEDYKFDYIFVDDLDSISKGSRNTFRILKLLGFDDHVIEVAKKNPLQIDQELKSNQNISVNLRDKGILVISSATMKKGINSLLFRKLLNFDVGSSINFVRNIDDIFVGPKNYNKLIEILNRMGPGAIIFTESQEEAIELEKIIPNSKFISSKNIQKIDDLIDIYQTDEEMEEINIENGEENEDMNELIDEDVLINNGELSYLIGVCSPYSVLVRGLDLPYKIRYVVFWGIPKRKLNLNNLENYRNIYPIQKMLSFLFFRKKMVTLERIKDFIKQIQQPKIISTFVIKDDTLYSIDVKTYLQASGRSSRITPYGVTKGVSFIFDDEIFLEPFSKSAYFNNFEILTLDRINIDQCLGEVDSSRRKDNDQIDLNTYIDFKTYLMIVESPTKAKQIAGMFGNPGVTKIGNVTAYEVFSPMGILIIVPSLGHIVELSVDQSDNSSDNQNNIYNVIIENVQDLMNVKLIYCFIKKCRDCNRVFASRLDRCIYCSSESIVSTMDNVNSLKSLSYFVDGIIVATDPDSEGEKISFDLVNLLRPRKYFRIVFNEVTKRAIVNSLQNPTEIRKNLVDAQLVRRIEDRWIGFALSKILQDEMGEYNISAGRVQSPILHWIVQRYKEYNNKKRVAIVEEFNLQFIDSEIRNEAELEIDILDEFYEKFNVYPFNTSDILIFANNVLKIDTSTCMQILQKLFENGLITYHRTDSYYISDQGINIAKEIFSKNGWEFTYKSFEKAHTHEAIRITKPLEPDDIKVLYQDKISNQELRLYEMIYKRFLACFTDNNRVKVVKYRFSLRKGDKENSIEQNRVVDFEGLAFQIFPYLVYKSPYLQKGKYTVRVKNIKKPTTILYSQADIIKMMKEKEIGRPSTYSSTIQKILSRGYVIEKFNKLIPTKKGIIVDQILHDRYSDFVSEQRTKDLLKKIDEVEQNLKNPVALIQELLNETQHIITLNLKGQNI